MEARRIATFADLDDVSDRMVGEIINGVLHTSPRPAPRHARASSAIGGQVYLPWQVGRGGPGGWEILDEPELRLGPHALVPDIAGWRRASLPELPALAYFETPPDWICEVLSPSTARLDRTQKLSIYAEFGVSHAWMVDPIAKVIEVLRNTEQGWLRVQTATDETHAELEPFVGVPFDVTLLWS